jgi:hypothetical protein
MEAKDLLAEGYGRALASLEAALKGLSCEDLDWQPRPDCNSIGWLSWHVAREQDAAISYLTREEQLWTKDGWYHKFNRSADPKDYGTGHTLEHLASFHSPDGDIILAYLKAVIERSQKYLVSVTVADLDQVTKMKSMEPPPTAGLFLLMMLSECNQHAGQAGYLRGLRQGIGWQKY